MSRSKGSFSSKQAKEMAAELEILNETPYKYNFDCIRMIEMLLCQRIAEQVCDYPDDMDIHEKVVTVEIPVLGDLTIKPRVFHEVHGMSNKPSIRFEFEFTPTTSFKTDIYKAYMDKVSNIPAVFSGMYGEQLKELYNKLRAGE